MSDDVRLTTRADIVRASYDLDAAKRNERIVEHGDFAVAFIDDRVDVFRFDGLDVVETWTTSR